MHHIVKSDVCPLGNRLTRCDTNRYIGQIFIGVWKGSKFQGLIESPFRSIGETDSWDLVAVDVEAYNRDGAALSKAGGRASVGAKTKIEAFKVEGLYPCALYELNIGVQSERAELEQVDRASGAGLLWW